MRTRQCILDASTGFDDAVNATAIWVPSALAMPPTDLWLHNLYIYSSKLYFSADAAAIGWEALTEAAARLWLSAVTTHGWSSGLSVRGDAFATGAASALACARPLHGHCAYGTLVTR